VSRERRWRYVGPSNVFDLLGMSEKAQSAALIMIGFNFVDHIVHRVSVRR
jgi:hypothetical protein